MSPRLVLVGMPGSGKSTVGAALARSLGMPFADSDNLVIEMTGRSVGDIFARDGEPGFRIVEAAAIVAALRDFPGVLAVGGGAVTSASVRDALRDSGVDVVLLEADLDELLRRVRGTEHRPLLAGDAERRLRELSDERSVLYRDVASRVVATSGRTVAEVVEAILAAVAGEVRE